MISASSLMPCVAEEMIGNCFRGMDCRKEYCLIRIDSLCETRGCWKDDLEWSREIVERRRRNADESL